MTMPTAVPTMRNYRHHPLHRLPVLLLLALLAGLAVGPAAARTQAQDPEAAWQSNLRDVQIPMRDGKSLAANILLPDSPGTYPCVLVQTPYNKDRMGREYGDDDSRLGNANAGRGSSKAWSKFDRDHYAWVFVDWRGFYGSRAAMQGVNRRQWKRGQDGYDCVEWLAAQSWCNGKVGTWGGSALGKQQFDTMIEQPPHLVCCVPLIAAQGTRYSTYYEGGVQIRSVVEAHDRLGFGVGDFVNKNRLPSRLWDIAERLGNTPQKIAVPCLLVSGWWDNYPRDVVQQFNDIIARGRGKASESKLIMGPWAHTVIDVTDQGDLKFPDAEYYSTTITKEFFDYYLRDKTDSGWKERARVHAYQCSEGWATGDNWAALTGKPRTMFLHAAGGIRDAAPIPGDGEHEPAPTSRSFTFDPRNPSPTLGGQNLPPLTFGPKDCASIERRRDVLIYRTDELTAPLCVRGEIELNVPFSCNRVDADLHVRVCDTIGDHSYLVGETTIRAKLRDGRSAQLLTPGQVVDLKLTLPPHAYTWAKGHQLTLIVTGCNAPRYEPNNHTGSDGPFDARAAKDVTETLHHERDRCAQLILPVVEPLKKQSEGTDR